MLVVGPPEVMAMVVVIGWLLNLTSTMCAHSIRSPDGLVNSMKHVCTSPHSEQWSCPCHITSSSIVGMPSMRTPVMASSPIVECLPQSHVVMPDTTPTHGEGQPPLALDPFTAIIPGSV